jgi:hypothetical protein
MKSTQLCLQYAICPVSLIVESVLSKSSVVTRGMVESAAVLVVGAQR